MYCTHFFVFILCTLKHTISGRFDFAFNGEKLKIYEYNADSASTLVEYAVVTKRWMQSVGLSHLGRSAGSYLLMNLKAAWQATGE